MPKRFTQIVYRFGDTGTRFSADEIIQRDMPDRPKSCSKATFINYHYQALSIAQKRGIIKKTMSPKRTHINCLQSVQYWERQLRGSRYRNASASYNSSNTTRSMYVRRLASFDRWLTARSFTIKQNVRVGNHTLEERILETRFENVEQLLTMFDDSAISKKDVTRIIRTYLIDPMHRDVGPSSMSTTFSAIMSYFAKNESPVGMKYDPRDHDTQEMRDEGGLTLDEWHRMLTEGKPSALLTAVLLVKFQAGLDSSTLADRFNFEAYSQIAKYFGTNNHAAWETARCPVPIRLVRMKTGVRFITFLDADAITAIQNYLDWRIGECGGFDPDGPLFVRSGRPLKSIWISMEMGKLAVNAGLQKKIGNRMYKIRAHELRDLLKTTLMDCRCAQYVADFILGHKPRDSYEKPAMYPDTLRREYAKASGKINVISKTESMLGGESPVGSETRLGEIARLQYVQSAHRITPAVNHSDAHRWQVRRIRACRLFQP